MAHLEASRPSRPHQRANLATPSLDPHLSPLLPFDPIPLPPPPGRVPERRKNPHSPPHAPSPRATSAAPYLPHGRAPRLRWPRWLAGNHPRRPPLLPRCLLPPRARAACCYCWRVLLLALMHLLAATCCSLSCCCRLQMLCSWPPPLLLLSCCRCLVVAVARCCRRCYDRPWPWPCCVRVCCVCA